MSEMNVKIETKVIQKPDYRKKAKQILLENIVPILFIIICLIGVKLAKQPPLYILNELVARVARNSFIVLALIIPVLAGMGLNFAIVLGAMAGQIAIIAVTHWKITGLAGLLTTVLLCTPFAIIFGYLTGKLLNKTKGQEMITSMILGFFANGLYQLLFLFLVGTIIPMKNPVLVLSAGVGIKNTIDLTAVKYSLDNIFKLSMTKTMIAFGVLCVAVMIVHLAYRVFIKKSKPQNMIKYLVYTGIFAAIGTVGLMIMNTKSVYNMVLLPIVTLVVIGLLCLFNVFIVKTKLGQEFRTVGQDMHIAKVSGIHVDKVRVIAIIISTVLAAWGQIIFLQNIGTLNTYGSHEQVGMFAAAALLIGGASVTKATIGHALMGTILLHTLFIVSPQAGKNLLGSAEIGEYFRSFVAYGVIGVSLGLHAWKHQVQSKKKTS
ncbi:simple sugar transport system permease protein [Geosporobacter subterraneus DSM 17957]|uniref:Simple sugar transport system permease protein n=1 Tax=Geosporobacter subterraneus DSM 17957 TaxID=1121919 RepID=A0A1M6LUY0_9FIRM|nr:ABC transporter permease [Geosporobacter subterraneus]SHJ75048.1 simple sugar transport system permease protein [Geosporobacter subterraneus DSM 17957]